LDKKQLDHPPITFYDFGLDRPKRSICQTHRKLYNLLIKENFTPEDKTRAIKVLEEAYQYGIKMGKRLAEKK
jgi:hypothetical protein